MIIDILEKSFIGMVLLSIGFILGTFYDIMFVKIYSKLDPDKINNKILITITCVQLYLLCIVFYVSYNAVNNNFDRYMINTGIALSQIFLFKFSADAISNIIYNRRNIEQRKTSTSVLQSLLSEIKQ